MALVADQLRQLADRIDADGMGVKNLAWVIAHEAGTYDVGLFGTTESCGADALLLLAIGSRKIVDTASGA